MAEFILLWYLSFLIITITPVIASVGLQTQKGIIYGQETQYSVEYLG
jgi:hypothetical protein